MANVLTLLIVTSLGATIAGCSFHAGHVPQPANVFVSMDQQISVKRGDWQTIPGFGIHNIPTASVAGMQFALVTVNLPAIYITGLNPAKSAGAWYPDASIRIAASTHNGAVAYSPTAQYSYIMAIPGDNGRASVTLAALLELGPESIDLDVQAETTRGQTIEIPTASISLVYGNFAHVGATLNPKLVTPVKR